MPASDRDKRIAARMREILLALREKYLENRGAGKDVEACLPLSDFGKDEITRATLSDLRRSHLIKILDDMVYFDGQGFNEAFLISEKEKRKAP